MTVAPREERAAALRRALAGPLPGPEAQRAAWPVPHRFPAADEDLPYGPAAVLVAVFPAGSKAAESESARSRSPGSRPGAGGSVTSYRFPLIRRRADMRHHGGQISLPGGECAAEEIAPLCALREAEEETGLPAADVEVLGLLTPVLVPVSLYRIQPVVGWLPAEPSWRAQASEVDAILLADPDRLLEEGLRGVVRREREGIRVDAPAYVIPDATGEEAQVWGATAIILAEFLTVWKRAREAGGTQ